MSERVVLAYSGGLDTSVGIGWLRDQTGKEVVALAVDLGQGGEDMDTIRQRALDVVRSTPWSSTPRTNSRATL